MPPSQSGSEKKYIEPQRWLDQDGDGFVLHMDDPHAPFATIEIHDSEVGRDSGIYVSRTRAKEIVKWFQDALDA